MMSAKFLNRIIELIHKTGGISVDLKTNKVIPPKDYWMFPKYPSKTKIVPQNIDLKLEIANFIQENNTAFFESDTYLGIWLNPKTKEYYFDVSTTINDKDQALIIAREVSIREGRNIAAIYNPQKDETIFL